MSAPGSASVASCASSNPIACVATRVLDTVVRSLSCSCPPPEILNPLFSAADAVLAAYTEGGCVTPMGIARTTVPSDTAAMTLRKPAAVTNSTPASMQRSAAGSLHIRGSDLSSTATWTLTNAELIRARSPWLQVADSGTVDMLAVKAAFPASYAVQVPNYA